MKRYFKVLVLWFILAVVTSEDQCPATSSQCQCDFSNDADDGGESMGADASTKSSALAAAAGAMSPLLIGGAGFGIWKLIKGRGDSPKLDRQDSDLSETSSQGIPPKYSSRRGSRVGASLVDLDNDDGDFRSGGGRQGWGQPGPGPTPVVNKSKGNDNINSWMF